MTSRMSRRVQRQEARQERKEQRRLKNQSRHRGSRQETNVVSLSNHRKERQWTQPDFKPLRPRHYKVIEAIRSYPIVIVNGPAGCLKTYLALQTSLELIKEGYFDYIIYARQDIDRPNERSRGALPGDETEKFSELLMPIEDNLRALVPPGEMKYVLSNIISGSRIDVIRGRSPLNTIIIADEAQNMDYNALKCVMTRAPEDCSMVILLGDYKGQKDVNTDCFNAFHDVCVEAGTGQHKGVHLVNLYREDVMRSEVCKTVIDIFNNIEQRKNARTDQPRESIRVVNS